MSGDWMKPDTSLAMGSGVKRGGKTAAREGVSGSTLGGESKGVISGDPFTGHFHDRPNSAVQGKGFSTINYDGDGLSK